MANKTTNTSTGQRQASAVSDKKLSFMDYVALYHMSLRRYFWQVDGRQGSETFRNNSPISSAIWILSMLVAYLPVILALYVVTSLPGILLGNVLMALPLIPALIYVVICYFIAFNRDKVKYNLHFTKSTWWLNTGVRPSEIKKDRGLYGEYIATVMAEECLKNCGVYGRVLNNVIVPKKNGDFTEIDIVSVNECGIHVIEAKARGGAFYGGFIAPTWQQKMGNEIHEMENPLIQNQNHINFLLEYLYDHLPDGACRDKATYPYNAANVVLFASLQIEDHLDHSQAPTEYFFGNAEGRNGYQYCDLRTNFKVRFSKQEVDAIADVLDEISHYTREQLDSMIIERQHKYDNGSIAFPITWYFWARIEFKETDGTTQTTEGICRLSGDYYTFLDGNGMFYALPSAKFIKRGTLYKTVDEVYAELNAKA